MFTSALASVVLFTVVLLFCLPASVLVLALVAAAAETLVLFATFLVAFIVAVEAALVALVVAFTAALVALVVLATTLPTVAAFTLALVAALVELVTPKPNCALTLDIANTIATIPSTLLINFFILF